jgi:hypothetical protein
LTVEPKAVDPSSALFWCGSGSSSKSWCGSGVWEVKLPHPHPSPSITVSHPNSLWRGGAVAPPPETNPSPPWWSAEKSVDGRLELWGGGGKCERSSSTLISNGQFIQKHTAGNSNIQ